MLLSQMSTGSDATTVDPEKQVSMLEAQIQAIADPNT